MCAASSASRTYGRSASASEYTAIARMPIRRAVRITRRAISPRLATSTDSSTRPAYWQSEPQGRGAAWTDEPQGRGAAWTEERGRATREGGAVKGDGEVGGAPEASGRHRYGLHLDDR